jgi:hypothetical protein
MFTTAEAPVDVSHITIRISCNDLHYKTNRYFVHITLKYQYNEFKALMKQAHAQDESDISLEDAFQKTLTKARKLQNEYNEADKNKRPYQHPTRFDHLELDL